MPMKLKSVFKGLNHTFGYLQVWKKCFMFTPQHEREIFSMEYYKDSKGYWCQTIMVLMILFHAYNKNASFTLLEI